jgi:arabinogalactan endo-1,4-beta-galactosidase
MRTVGGLPDLLGLAVLAFLSPGWAAAPVTFQVDMSVQMTLGSFCPGQGERVTVAGDAINNWDVSASVLTNSVADSNLYVGTFNLTNASGSAVNYKFVMDGVWERNGIGPGGAQNRRFTLEGAPQTLPAVFFDTLTTGSSLQATPTAFRASVVGGDLSMLAFLESQGNVYREGGQAEDALQMLKRKGLNCVRLRLYTSSAAQAQADPYNCINNLAYTLPLAVRVKTLGQQLMLDCHYSDTWADPGHQAIPTSWTNLSFPQLVARMREYSSNAIAALNSAGAMPDYVQVGNEITGGLLWPAGHVGGTYDTPTQWSQLGQLLGGAVQGIRDAAGDSMPKVVVHTDTGANWGATLWFFDNLARQKVPFDIIGLSYYPQLHGSPTNFFECLAKTTKRYNRSVFVVETSFPWTNSTTTNLHGIPVGTNGQVQYVVALARIIKGVPGAMVPGVLWWGTEYPGSGTGFFDSGGNVLPVAGAFGHLSAPVQLKAHLNGNDLILTWPLSGVGMALNASTNLQGPWWAVTNEAQNTNLLFGMTVPAEPDALRAHRLQGN